ncbi:cysteine desulfurase [Deferribacter desulfuricans SSM1]|uniref:cysteine desulfurase n=1 Tax=Deferribacter desulfuricans (strain DSM 14783 / JCM 11476 / NBRC 101012 / SSM1) TaxID=639282 RepID=D3PA73_DEFDS|nr:cysteine desulfurase family protein [Deferribacter desulfuricans]BAI81613.1 cysteine desulfurase [Deferribacter desulfuricans SSM1]
MYIYFDNSATTPIDPRVVEAMQPYFKEKFANPSSIHALGREIREDVEKARETVAKSIKAEPQEIIFTASGSESDNLAIKGVAYGLKHKGNHIITSKIEHKAVLETCKFLEKEGFEVTYLSVDKNGIIDIDELKKAIKKETILISVMLANNEIGTIQPIEEISKIAREHDVLVHTDAVQAMGKMEVDVNKLGVHLLTFSGHKIYAPKGIGVLYVDERVKEFMVPVIHGGHHEYGLRAGTENVPYIIGLAKACEIIDNELESDIKKIKEVRDRFESRILNEIPETILNGHKEKRVCSISNITFKYIEGEALMVYANEVCCSTGSACTSDSVDASHVLYAIGVDPVDAHGALRFSFGRFNTLEEADKAVEIIKKSVEKLRMMSPLYNKK